MTTEDWFWKAFEATGSPEAYLLFNSQRKNKKNNNDERVKRNTSL